MRVGADSQEKINLFFLGAVLSCPGDKVCPERQECPEIKRGKERRNKGIMHMLRVFAVQ
jgi:hypothetical protein